MVGGNLGCARWLGAGELGCWHVRGSFWEARGGCWSDVCGVVLEPVVGDVSSMCVEAKYCYGMSSPLEEVRSSRGRAGYILAEISPMTKPPPIIHCG